MSDQQMNEVPSEQPQEGGQPAPAAAMPGAALAAQRQKKGWSVEQVASLVKLSPRQIQAIEADNYSALPGLAVARGFVRSYAKAVGLDANELAAAMPQDSPVAQRDHIVPNHSLSTPFSEGPLPAMMMSTRGNSSPVALIAGVVVLAVAVGAAAVRWTELGDDVPQLGWLKAHKGGDAPASEAAPDAVQPSADAATASSSDTPVNARVETITPNAAAEEAAKPAASESVAAAPAPAPVKPAAPSTPVPAAGAGASASPATSVAAAQQPAAPAAVPSGLNIVNSKDLLRLTFREDSWVEIRRADKTTVISRLLKAGTTEAFDVSDATTLVVGNASGVDATLRGQPLDLKATGGSNVARLNLN